MMESTNPNTLLPSTSRCLRSSSCPASTRRHAGIASQGYRGAAVAANTTALAGMQALGQKQVEILTRR